MRPLPNQGVQTDLIYDVGFHNGEDAAFYLRKGFRVVGIEGHPALIERGQSRYSQEISAGKLILVKCLVGIECGEVLFYESDNSAWGTVNRDWVSRNERMGVTSRALLKMPSVSLSSIIEEHGVPYFAKIDIEGADLEALSSLRRLSHRPKYVSIESSKSSFSDLRHEFDTFESLGYTQFKVVPQRWVSRQRLRPPAREGLYVDYRFSTGSSGAFGEEAPGKWLTREEALDRYRRIFLQYALTGDDPLIRNRYLRRALAFAGFRGNWYDTHGKRAVD